ncbi:MAG: aminodeoxychorismate/anthranilate synthase component II [Pseudomonadota bacterium]|nr:aminodeoxychorismate/anthranilate synthase component II [Pseudomonadota bacterium]
MIIAFKPDGLAQPMRRASAPLRRANVLMIDNRDSFTAHLAAACRAGGASVEVVDQAISAGEAYAYALRYEALIMLSPGPGGPRDAGCCMELIALAAGQIPLIGVCLGHQAIVDHHLGRVVRAHEPCHGKSSAIDHDGCGPFAGLPSPMRVGRYHSLCTPLNDIPERLRVHAVLDGMAMAVSNFDEGQFGLQFHPESILTPMGARLLDGLLDWAGERRRAFAGLTARTAAKKIAA